MITNYVYTISEVGREIVTSLEKLKSTYFISAEPQANAGLFTTELYSHKYERRNHYGHMFCF